MSLDSPRRTRGRTSVSLDSFTPGGRWTEAADNDRGSFSIVIGRPHFLEAKRLLQQNQRSAAVASAHATCEVYVGQVLRDLMGMAGLDAIRFQGSGSMAFHNGNKELRAWYERLSGDKTYRDQPFWTSGRLTAHMKRRNRIVHGGYVCSRAEAAESLVVLDEVAGHLTKIVQGVRAAGHDDAAQA